MVFQIFNGSKSFFNQSGEIQRFSFETSQTVRIYFHSNNETNFSGFKITFKNCKYKEVFVYVFPTLKKLVLPQLLMEEQIY